MHHEILFPTDQSFHTNLRHAVLFCVSIAGAPQDTRHSIDTCHRSQLGQRKPPTTGRLANTWLSMCAVYAVGCLGCFPTSFPLLTATRTGVKSSSSRPWCALSPCAHTVAGRLGRESHRGLFARDTRGVNIYTCIHIQVLDHTHIHTTHTHAPTRTTSCACTWHNHVQTCVQVVLHAQPLPPPQVGRSIKGEGDAATSARPQ